MARNLSDVLHYFDPELAEKTPDAIRVDDPDGGPSPRPRALRLVGVPIGGRDVVRAAFAWNVAVEIVRLGGRAVILSPDDASPSPLWPQAGTGPLDAELRPTLAKDLESLHRAARDTLATRDQTRDEEGVVFVRIPPAWLSAERTPSALLNWTLLFTSSEPVKLQETLELARTIGERQPEARVGVTIHGAQSRGEAENAFDHLARASRRNTGRDLRSYGLLVDDLEVYRAIVAQRPIGLAHPQSPAARALRDVAELLINDMREDVRD